VGNTLLLYHIIPCLLSCPLSTHIKRAQAPVVYEAENPMVFLSSKRMSKAKLVDGRPRHYAREGHIHCQDGIQEVECGVAR